MDVKQIETAIAKLPPEQIAELADWFHEFQAQVWDAQIADDAAAGRLDGLLDEARSDLEGGRCKPL